MNSIFIRIVIALVFAFLSSCTAIRFFEGLDSKHEGKLMYPGHGDQELDASSIAVVELGLADKAVIQGMLLKEPIVLGGLDGNKNEYSSTSLLPGSYEISTFYETVIATDCIFNCRETTQSSKYLLYVESGHTYSLHMWHSSVQLEHGTTWVRDETNEELIDLQCTSDKGEAVSRTFKLAEQGIADAQFKVGRWKLRGGRCTNQNKDEAVLWLTRAAEQNYSPACFELGRIYFEGIVVWKDIEKAGKWYLHCADRETPTVKRQLNIIEEQYPGIWSRINVTQ